MCNNLKNKLIRFLEKDESTLSCAESCTGGGLSDFITDIPGISKYFYGGIVSYSNEIKNKILNVKKETLKNFGAVSKETVNEMAVNLQKKFNTNIAISISGIAGPTGGTREKPVGTVFICIIKENKKIVKKVFFKGNRKEIKKQTIEKALNLLIEKF